jgi:anti-anti-sigma factor
MDIHRQNGTLRINGLLKLNGRNARLFRDEVCAALAPELEHLEIDLSRTASVDSAGLAALVAIYETAQAENRNGGVTVRLLDPQPPVRQMFELTRAHQLFEIILQNGKTHEGLIGTKQNATPHESE